ncbi:transient receptor potential cation channel subfamily M member 2 [Aplochiton taeniatus]
MREDVVDPSLVSTLAVSTVTPPRLLSMSLSFQRCSLAAWMKENIKKKECHFYVESERKGMCKCGHPEIKHTEEAMKPKDFVGESWDKHRHVREVPTDAFGDINFGGLGQKTGKYVRVSTDTTTELLYELMTERWRLPPPNLLISVTGGAKNFYLKAHLKGMFHRGLIKVAQTTGAWIITGGTHAGVMKHVGKAVRDYALSSSSLGKPVVALGIATWGILHNQQALVHPEGRFPAHYSLDVEGQGRLSCLDNNHTHFLLVDDGTHGQYGAEIELRSRLEKLISQRPLGNRESGVKIPVVCVVLDGGPGTLNTIFNAMLNGTPCVILEGSGRLADVIAQVAGLPVGQVTLALIHQLMKKFFASEYEAFSELKIIEWTKKIQDIIRIPNLLTVFRIREEKHGDVDVAILKALLKASQGSECVGRGSWEQQLELAVAWNRVDIAESEIFTEESQWKSCDLHQAMLSALVGHRPRFVRLLLENGVCLRQFFKDEGTLLELYSQLPNCLFFHKLVKRFQSDLDRKSRGSDSQGQPGRKISLTHVSREVQRLLGSFTRPMYPPPPDKYGIDMPVEGSLLTLPDNERDLQVTRGYGDDGAFRDPGRDIFLWAILQNSRELAEIAWEQCRDSMAAALAASKILKRLSRDGEKGSDEVEEMRELASHYEKHAMGVFSECHRCDEQRAQRLLVRVSPSWGQTTCLRLALEADDKSFVAQSGVQALLTQIWCGELAVENDVWRVLCCMLFFPLIYTGFLAFRRDGVIQRDEERNKEINIIETFTQSSAETLRWKSHVPDLPSSKPLKALNCWSRLASLYGCPQVKFYWNIVSYFAFLFLFAIVLVVDFQVMPSWLELLLYIWLLSLVCEEVRQLFHDPDGFGFRKKAKMYINDLWNILDVLSIVLFLIGLGFRLSTELFYPGKVILCIDFVVFCLRLMAIFTISRTLGPKIIIVRRMMMDMFFFMFLLSIWVVAYGVAKQGILIHNEQRLDWILRGAVYEPYLIIFGNVPTNIDNAQFDINACSVNGTDTLKPKCPVLNDDQRPAFPEWLTIIMLCVYLLFANILLLNLLIAIFNYTFQEVQDNTDAIWKFQRYELIKEYHSRPTAPPPFILLSHLYLFVRCMVLRRPPYQYKQFKDELPEVQEEELLSWEAFMKDKYLVSARKEHNKSMEQRIQDTSEKVDTMSELLGQEDETDSAAMVKRLTRLEEQVFQSAKALQWIMDTLKAQGHTSKADPPLLVSSGTLCEIDGREKMGQRTEEVECHVEARQRRYPDSPVTRFPVPEEKVPWEVWLDLTSLDKYRNPGGRTGLRGRGALKHLGPNLIVDPVVTCWRDSEHSALEFLAVWDETKGLWALPGGVVKSNELLPDKLERLVGKQLYDQIKAKANSGTKVYEGYVDDCRNTDNAWVETSVLNIHLCRGSLQMADINRKANSSLGSAEMVQCKEVSKRTMVCSYQRYALQKVAELYSRTF